MLVREAIGAVLRRERMRRGLTLRELSASARISLPYLSEIERGRKDPSSEIIAAIAPVLDLALADVVARATRELATAEAATSSTSGAASVLDLTPVIELPVIELPVIQLPVIDLGAIAPSAPPSEPQLLAA